MDKSEYRKKYYEANKDKIRENSRKYREENKDKIKEDGKKYYVENKDKKRDDVRKYYVENKDKIRDDRKKYREENKDKIRQHNKKYSAENKDKIRDDGKKYREENKDKIRQSNKKYFAENKDKIREGRRKRYKKDPNFKLRMLISYRVRKELKNNNIKKTSKSAELLGCTIQEARGHIEKQFKEGMTWDNHGFKEWHIDHIIPCASFDLTDPEQQKKCFHYTNLQPLWAHENMSKGVKIPNMGNI